MGEVDFLKAFSFNGSTLGTTPVSQSLVQAAPGMPGGFLSISANGAVPGSGIVWVSQPFLNDAENGVVAGIMRAFDASDLTKELWNSRLNATRDDVGIYAKYVAPTVANGRVYLATFSNFLHVYGLLSSIPARGGGQLTVSSAASSLAVDLTATGTADWALWPGYDHKASGGGQIEDIVAIGPGTWLTYANDPRALTFTDGTPTPAASSTAGVYTIEGVGNGFQVVVPADASTRTLKLYVGGFSLGSSTGALSARLSDGSAPDVLGSPFTGGGTYDAVYTLTYSAASASQNLNVRWTQLSQGGFVRLQGAALSGGSPAAPPAAPPSSPTGVGASDGTSPSTVVVTWSAPSGASSYTVYRSTSAGAQGTALGPASGTSFSDTTVTAGVVYFYSVTATGPGGTSAASAQDSGFAALPPAAPTGVTASDGTSPASVTVTWDAVNGAATYTIYRSTSAGARGTAIGASGGSPLVDSGAAPGVVYYYGVTATGPGGVSALSSQDSGFASAPVSGTVNVASAANGGVASASSTFGPAYPLSAINDGDRRGANWASGGGWADATVDTFPDWVQITFTSTQTIDRVVVYTLPNLYGPGIGATDDPSDVQTFTLFGVVDFDVQAWNGSDWTALATVTGNNLVKRTVAFAAVATDRIRLNVRKALFGYSRIVELEAWTGAGGSATSTSIASSANPAGSGTSVVLTATVTGNAPTGPVAFSDNGSALPGCGTVLLSGAGSDRSAVCTTVKLGAGSHALIATYTGDGANAGSASAALTEVVNDANAPVNVALAANGGVASASTAYGSAYPVSAVNDGDRTGWQWANGGGWADATADDFPDWVQVNFSQATTIDRVVVFTLPDQYGPAAGPPVEPGDAQTFSLFGVTDFAVQTWDGSSWVTRARVSGNNLVRREVTFPPTTTDRIRVKVNNALFDYSRLVEVEAWSIGGYRNVGLATYGGVASASSVYGPEYPLAAVNDGDRTGATWSSGGGWADATPDAFPDSLQIAFDGPRTIDRVVVYTLPDQYGPGVGPTTDPSDTQTFTLFGIVDFTVQAWDGSDWFDVGSVSGNNLVKRVVSFAPVRTDRVRVTITNALFGYSRVVELEAWGQ